MIVVIIAGGSGTRLWPLSTVDYPKHLLQLTNERSLLQNTYDRVKELADDILVVSEASHSKFVFDQLPEIDKNNILIEPARRGTASCVIWALSEIKKRKLGNQPIFILWADHLIRDKRGFTSAVKQADELAEKLGRLVFLGVEPTYPSTGFGYIKKGARLENGFKNVYELEKFVEKPPRDVAEEYFESGDYLWNMGYLMGTLDTFEHDIKDYAPRLWRDYNKLLSTDNPTKIYEQLEPEAVEYALSEKVPDAVVVPGAFDWVDIGSFQDLHGVSHQDRNGNHVKGVNVELDSVTNSYVRNEQDLPVIVIGLDNIAVVSTESGILITNKNYAQKVGEVSKRLQKNDKN